MSADEDNSGSSSEPDRNVQPLPSRRHRIDPEKLIAQFERFHASNPLVFEVLRDSAIEWCRRFGRSVVGPSLIFGKVRWEVTLRTNDPNFKLNNNYQSFYTRLIMYRYPEVDGIFRTRRSVADSWIAELKRREQGKAA